MSADVSSSPEADPRQVMVGQFKVTVQYAQAYLNDVMTALLDKPHIYNEFLDLLRKFQFENIDRDFVVSEAKSLLGGHPKLIEGFDAFLGEA